MSLPLIFDNSTLCNLQTAACAQWGLEIRPMSMWVSEITLLVTWENLGGCAFIIIIFLWQHESRRICSRVSQMKIVRQQENTSNNDSAHTHHYTVYHTHEQTVNNTAMLFLKGTLWSLNRKQNTAVQSTCPEKTGFKCWAKPTLQKTVDRK